MKIMESSVATFFIISIQFNLKPVDLYRIKQNYQITAGLNVNIKGAIEIQFHCF